MAKTKVVYRNRRTKKRKRRKKDHRVPLLPLAGLAVTLMNPISQALAGNYEGALAEAGARFTGYNYQSKTFDVMYAVRNGWMPILLGGIGSVVATKVGVNRAIAKIPFAGKYIKL